MTTPSTLKMSQGYEVLKPKSDHAIPIPCNEWDYLKDNIKEATTDPWLFQMVGSTLVGAGLATLITIMIGGVSTQILPNAIVIAWATTFACFGIGAACLIFAGMERTVHLKKNKNVLTQMELIESRFDRPEIE